MARKRKTKGVRYWKKKAWDAFSKYIRLRDALGTTGDKAFAVCCTCGKISPAFGKGCMQAGHFIPGRKNAILFEEKGVHAQCYNCNVNLKGNWPQYIEFMQRTYGVAETDRLLMRRHLTLKYTPADLEEIRDTYKLKLKELE